MEVGAERKEIRVVTTQSDSGTKNWAPREILSLGIGLIRVSSANLLKILPILLLEYTLLTKFKTALILSTFILAVLSLYWAVLCRVEQNMSSLVVFVVDFDGQVAPYTDVTPVVGPMIVQIAQSLLAPSGTVGWQSQPASVSTMIP
jgi:hypothetical protein